MAQGLDKVYGKEINKIHGSKKNSVVMGSQGASAFLGDTPKKQSISSVMRKAGKSRRS